jgi:uncharacterized protein (UPF0276 family)
MSPTRHPPAYGIGIGYRPGIHRELLHSRKDIDFLEIPAEDYVDANRRKQRDPGERLLQEALRHFPAVGHGSDVSVGSAEPAPRDYLERVGRFVERTPVSEYSEHVTCTRAGAESVGCFVAIPFTDLGVAATVANAKRVARAVGLPFLLENVCYHFAIPGATMREEEFIRRVAEEVDCAILLDITNVYINGHNHGYDPRAYIRALPADRIQHGHYCGVMRLPDGYLLDTHSELTPPEVWKLVDETLATTDLRALILERDSDFLPWENTLNEIKLAREIFLKHRPAKAPAMPHLSRFAPPQAPPDDPPDYSKDLALFQRTLFSLILDQELARAVDREGEAALKHSGLAREERTLLAAIPAKKRDLISQMILAERRFLAEERAAEREAELAQWTRVLGPSKTTH